MKKLLSLLLALVMVIGMLPMSVFASNATPFVDVREQDWFYDEIMYVYENGIMNGVSNNSFAPFGTTNRGMFVTVLWRLEGAPACEAPYFTDVQEGQYYTTAIRWAATHSIVSGVGNDLFQPEGSLTREQLVTILYRYANYKGRDVSARDDLSGFGDVASLSAFAEDAMKWAIAVGMINGVAVDGGMNLNPQGIATRGEMAALITRFYKNVIINGSSSSGEPMPISYTVNFKANGGPAVLPQLILEGGTVSEPTGIALNGYEFGGWYSDMGLMSRYDFSAPVTSNLNLYAKWVAPVDADEIFTVSFMRNDGTSAVHVFHEAAANTPVSQPIDPELEGYGFTGWYVEPSLVTPYDFSTPVTSNMALYAGWGDPSIDTENEEDTVYSVNEGGGTTYSISGVSFGLGTGYAVVNTNSTALLVLEFLDETAYWAANTPAEVAGLTPIVSAAAQTPAYCEMAPVAVPLDAIYDSIPERFVVRAVLKDSSGNQLCNPYYAIEYTQRYFDFENKSAEEYAAEYPEGELVYFSDSGVDFGILKSTVKKFTQTLTVTAVDVEGKLMPDFTYAFDTVIDGIAVGDIIYAPSQSGQLELFKVKTVDTSTGRTVMTPDEDVTLDEFYDVLKVEMRDPNSDVVATDGAQPFIDIIDVDDSFKKSISESINWKPGGKEGKINVSGKLTGSVTANVELRYDAKLFKKDYFFAEITTVTDLNLNVGVTATIDGEKQTGKDEWKGGKLEIPTSIPGLKVYTEQSVPFEWKFEGSFTLDFDMNATNGFTYDTDSGYEEINRKTSTINLGFKGEAEAKIGPKIALGVEFIEIITADIGVQAGIKGTVSTAVDLVNVTNEESKHGCIICLDGHADWFVNATASFGYEITKKLSYEVEFTIVEFSGPIKFAHGLVPGQFYASLHNPSDSMFGGSFHAGFGECPNKCWRTTLNTEDADGNAMTAYVEVLRSTGTLVDDGITPCAFYLYDGVYTAKATVDGEQVQKTFTVNKAAQTVTLTANAGDGKIVGTVKDSNTGSLISGASVVICQGELVVATSTTDSSGKFTLEVPEGQFEVKLGKDGYMTATAHVDVPANQTIYETIEMTPGEDGYGGFSGKIVDAATNNPIAGVSLEVREGANAPASAPVVKTMTTDSNGYYSAKGVEIAGIVMGLEAGSYTVTASKDGYNTTSFNVVIVGGVADTVHPNEPMSKVMASGEYRIVLTWGASPRDVDSHMVGTTSYGGTFHVYYSNKSVYDNGVRLCDLDVDDVTSYGPETITLRPTNEGPFYYYLYNYSGSPALSTSGSHVEIYGENGLIASFNMPTDQGSGRYWNVFAIVDGQLIVRNTVTSYSETSYASPATFGLLDEEGYDTSIEDNEPKEETPADPVAEETLPPVDALLPEEEEDETAPEVTEEPVPQETAAE